jgi:KDO2-lipid IV(A) lauroyltransferase
VSRIVFGLMYLLHALPLSIQAAVGNAAACLLYWVVGERREVIRVNLAKCFPEKSAPEREQLARAHFRAFIRSFLDRGMLWWAPAERIRSLVELEGMEHLRALQGRPVIVLAPHFVGLDAAFARLSLEIPLISMYARQKDPRFDALMTQGRERFGAKIFPRRGGLRGILRAMKNGQPFYYLPDFDVGREGAVFVPFFGVPAATVTGLADIARSTGAAVVPCVATMHARGYRARLYPAWTGYPSGDDAADARRMLAFVETRVLENPAQYYWLHKRFKTRPEGEPRFYA